MQPDDRLHHTTTELARYNLHSHDTFLAAIGEDLHALKAELKALFEARMVAM
jgi:hypothetical protein